MKLFIGSALVVAALLAGLPGLAVADPAPATSAEIDSLVAAYADLGMFNGVILVADHGRPLYQRAFGLANREWGIPNTIDTAFNIGSLTKPLTATLVLKLVAEKRIDLDAPITRYLPWYRKDTGDRVLLRHLLAHSSGIPSFTSNPRLTEFDHDSHDPMQFVCAYCSEDLESQPGERYAYSNSGYYLLGCIVESVEGAPFGEVLRRRLFEPLGMRRSSFSLQATLIPRRAWGYIPTLDSFAPISTPDPSVLYSTGGVVATAEDLLLWETAMNGDTYLPKEIREASVSPQIAAKPFSYGFGWFLDEYRLKQAGRSLRVASHGGEVDGFQSIVFRLLDDQRTIVILNNTGPTRLLEMAREITNVLYGEPSSSPVKPLAGELEAALARGGVDAAYQLYQSKKGPIDPRADVRPQDLSVRGFYLMRLGRTTEATLVFQLLERLFPPIEARDHIDLAQIFASLGQRERARMHFDRALALGAGDAKLSDEIERQKKRALESSPTGCR